MKNPTFTLADFLSATTSDNIIIREVKSAMPFYYGNRNDLLAECDRRVIFTAEEILDCPIVLEEMGNSAALGLEDCLVIVINAPHFYV